MLTKVPSTIPWLLKHIQFCDGECREALAGDDSPMQLSCWATVTVPKDASRMDVLIFVKNLTEILWVTADARDEIFKIHLWILKQHIFLIRYQMSHGSSFPAFRWVSANNDCINASFGVTLNSTLWPRSLEWHVWPRNQSGDKSCEDELISVISLGIFLFERLQKPEHLFLRSVFNSASLGSDLGRASSSPTEAE